MAFDVTVISVEQKQGQSDKGPYSYTEFNYDFRGQNKSMKIFPTLFKTYPHLKTALSSLGAGQKVGIDLVKNSKGYNELSNIITGDNQLSANNSVSSSTNDNPTKTIAPYVSDHEIGQQVGNALTNAVNSLGAKSTIAQIKDRAVEIIKLGNELKAIIKGGELLTNLKNDLEQQKQDTQAQAVNDDEDVPF